MFWESLPAPQTHYRSGRVTQLWAWQEENLMVATLFLLTGLTGWCSCCQGLLFCEALAFGCAAGCS